MNNSLIIRFFQAKNEPKTCHKFLEKHHKALVKYGITNITTNSDKWFRNPDVYVVVCENKESGELIGGIRLHVVNNIDLLPLEDAIGCQDREVFALVNQRSQTEITGELCGLWTDENFGELRLGKILVRAAIASAFQINMTCLLTLTSDYTKYISFPVGFRVITRFKNSGNFKYPNASTIARISEIRNLINLPECIDEEKMQIMKLVDNPTFRKNITMKNKTIDFEYALNLQEALVR